MSRIVRIATISLYLPEGPTRLEDNISRAKKAVEKAIEYQPDIICLPECYTILGSSSEDIIRSVDMATEVNNIMASIAIKGNCYIISNILNRVDNDIFNTAFIIDRKGNVIGKYIKTHLAAFEADLYGNKPGDELPVFEVDFGKIAIMICMDIHIVEVARTYGIKGAEILFWPTQAYGPTGELLTTLLRSRAFDNQIYCVASNFCQVPYLPGKHMGRACVVGLDGNILADTGNCPGVAFIDVDLDEKLILDWSYTDLTHILDEKYPDWGKLLFGLRRPELYKTLVETKHET
jgi:predicted amidohydrolase